MNIILRLEEFGMLLLGILAFSFLPFVWWWFLVFILVPDIGMLGYLFGSKVGAFSYNLFHHKGVAVLIGVIGIYLNSTYMQLAGIILFSHASFDRLFGYGLKYEKGFKFTHLGKIGK
tara:strand:- start:23855 stop:24205 length:351 start_codon:yes stop_codon:yes gene_type:complete